MKHRIYSLLALLFCVFTFELCRGQQSAMTVPQNLAQLTDEASNIVRGRVVNVTIEPHPQLSNLQTALVTLQINQTLKGARTQTFTFRQYISDLPRRGNAGYRRGQELLLLMTKPSHYGLSSPVGLEQGRFQIVRDPQGRAVALNGQANAGLFANMKADLQKRGVTLSRSASNLIERHQSGPIPLDDLTTLIQQLVRGE